MLRSVHQNQDWLKKKRDMNFGSFHTVGAYPHHVHEIKTHWFSVNVFDPPKPFWNFFAWQNFNTSLVLRVKMFVVWYYSNVSSPSKYFSSDVVLALLCLMSASIQHSSLSVWILNGSSICWLSWELSGSFWNILSSLKYSFSWVLSCMAESMGDWACCDKNFKRTERENVSNTKQVTIHCLFLPLHYLF